MASNNEYEHRRSFEPEANGLLNQIFNPWITPWPESKRKIEINNREDLIREIVRIYSQIPDEIPKTIYPND